MPSYPAFLSRVLRLQIRDRNLCRCGVIAAGAFRPAGKCRGLSEVLAFRRLQVSARDFKSRRHRYDNTSAYREHTAVVRTPARGIGSAIAVGGVFVRRPCVGVLSNALQFSDAARSGKTSPAIETAVSGKL